MLHRLNKCTVSCFMRKDDLFIFDFRVHVLRVLGLRAELLPLYIPFVSPNSFRLLLSMKKKNNMNHVYGLRRLCNAVCQQVNKDLVQDTQPTFLDNIFCLEDLQESMSWCR